MASVTSYFNSTLYRKTMGRYWPLWILWGVGWLFVIPLNLLNRYFYMLRWNYAMVPRDMGNPNWAQLADEFGTLGGFLPHGVILSAVFAVLSAMAVFSYLYSSRSACMMHALPLRREGLFTTQYLAGLSFLILPLMAVALVTLMAELVIFPSQAWEKVLPALGIWLLGMIAVSVFFFSFASFCAMFTGHILALPVFYGILNVLVLVIYTLITTLMGEFFYGYSGNILPQWVEWLTPAAALGEACTRTTQYTATNQVLPDGSTLYLTQGSMNSPLTLAVYAGAGLLLALAALAVYRRRHVESAGDVVSIPIVRPLFKYGVSFCTGLSLGMFTSLFFGWYHGNNMLPLVLCILFWTVIGYFAAEMLLNKTFRVFKAWKGCAAMVGIMALLCAAFVFDWFGVETRVPAPSDVAQVTVDGSFGYPSDGASLRFTSDDPALVEKAVGLHRAIVDQHTQDGGTNTPQGDDYISFHVTYTLKNGSTLERRYYDIPIYQSDADSEGTITWFADSFLRDRDLVEMMYGFDACEEGRLTEARLANVYNIQEEYYDDLYLDQSNTELLELWRAVRADFDAGTIGVRYLFHDDARLENTYRADLVFYWERPLQGPSATETRELIITLTPNAENTLAWLQAHGIPGEGYDLMLNARYYGEAESEYPDTQSVPAQEYA